MLTGYTSKFPYKIDDIEFQVNKTDSYDGDIIRAAHMNRLYDCAINLEKELINAPHGMDADILTSAAVKYIKSGVTTAVFTVPSGKVTVLGVNTIEELYNSGIVLIDTRPVSPNTVYTQVSYSVTGNIITITFEPAITSDYIVSVILMREL